MSFKIFGLHSKKLDRGRVVLCDVVPIDIDDFTLEAWIKPKRTVHMWRGRKFVVRNPWAHYATTRAGGFRHEYVNGIEIKLTHAPHKEGR